VPGPRRGRLSRHASFAYLGGRRRKFLWGGAGLWAWLAQTGRVRWMVQAVSRASCGVPAGSPVRRTASW